MKGTLFNKLKLVTKMDNLQCVIDKPHVIDNRGKYFGWSQLCSLLVNMVINTVSVHFIALP